MCACVCVCLCVHRSVLREEFEKIIVRAGIIEGKGDTLKTKTQIYSCLVLLSVFKHEP